MKNQRSARHPALPAGMIGLLASAGLSLQSAPFVIDHHREDLAVTSVETEITGSMLGGTANYDPINASYSIENHVLHFFDVGQDTDKSIDIEYFGEGEGFPPVDLTGGGTNTGIEVKVLSNLGAGEIEIVIINSEGQAERQTSEGVSPGVVTFPFADFEILTGDVDPTAVAGIEVGLYSKDIKIGAITAGDLETALSGGGGDGDGSTADPDDIRPVVKLAGTKKLNQPRVRHVIKGRATDNDEVDRVEVRVRGRGWRKARLRNNDRFRFRTHRLPSGKTPFKVRAFDTSSNRSRIARGKVQGTESFLDRVAQLLGGSPRG